MARGKIVLVCTAAPEKARLVAHGIAEAWADAERDVLTVDLDGLLPVPEPERWISLFQTLSPDLFRNFVRPSAEGCSSVSLHGSPGEKALRDLLALAVRTFAWTILIAPRCWPEQAEVMLEAADLVLWVGHAEEAFQEKRAAFLKDMTRFHYPHAHVQSWALPAESENETVFRRLAEDLCTHPDWWRPPGELVYAVPHSPSADIERVKDQVQPELLQALATGSELEVAQAKETVEACLARDLQLPSSPAIRGEILERVLQDVLGLGPLEPLLRDSSVSEVMVNGLRGVYVEKRGTLHSVPVTFSSEHQLRTLIDRIVAPVGRRVDESMPLCDARLADGSRVNVVLPPLALDGPLLTIRKFPAHAMTLAELQTIGSLSEEMTAFLVRAVCARKNILVSGGTGTGKTTFLNALSGHISDNERIVTIEDAAELRLQKPHVARLESRPPNAEGQGAVPIRRLVVNALRMRPDRIVVGECRGGEALDMLQAMNTGHDGSMTTLHANSPRDALGRLETMVLMAGLELPVRVVREQIRSAVHLVVQLGRLADGSRKVLSLTEVTGMEGDRLTTQELFRFSEGRFSATGLVSEGDAT